MSPVSKPDGTDLRPPDPSDTRHGPIPSSDRPGDRPGNVALLLFFVALVAAAVDILFWSRFMQIASDVWRAPPGVSGRSAVIRLMPAGLLIVMPIVVGLALGVRSARLGSRRGYVAICLQSFAVFVVVTLFVVGGNDNLAEWAISVGVAIATLALCLFVTRSRSQDKRTADSTDHAPFRAGYRTAAVLMIVGIDSGSVSVSMTPSVARRWITTRQRYDRTHALRDQGLPMRAIGRRLDLNYKTVRRYLRDASVDPLLAGGCGPACWIRSSPTCTTGHLTAPTCNRWPAGTDDVLADVVKRVVEGNRRAAAMLAAGPAIALTIRDQGR